MRGLALAVACVIAGCVLCAVSHAGMSCTRDVELVVAHCSHDPTTWLAEAKTWLPLGAKITVYSKCAETFPGAIRLPNVGREGHTFLHHIVSRYDSLAERTLFVMESADMTLLKRAMLRDLLTNWCAPDTYCPKILHIGSLTSFTIDEWKGTTYKPGASATTAPASVRPFGEWFKRFVDPRRAPPRLFCHTAMMSVSRDAILKRPRAFYLRLLRELEVDSNPEAGHFLERSWGAIFEPEP